MSCALRDVLGIAAEDHVGQVQQPAHLEVVGLHGQVAPGSASMAASAPAGLAVVPARTQREQAAVRARVDEAVVDLPRAACWRRREPRAGRGPGPEIRVVREEGRECGSARLELAAAPSMFPSKESTAAEARCRPPRCSTVTGSSQSPSPRSSASERRRAEATASFLALQRPSRSSPSADVGISVSTSTRPARSTTGLNRAAAARARAQLTARPPLGPLWATASDRAHPKAPARATKVRRRMPQVSTRAPKTWGGPGPSPRSGRRTRAGLP